MSGPGGWLRGLFQFEEGEYIHTLPVYASRQSQSLIVMSPDFGNGTLPTFDAFTVSNLCTSAWSIQMAI
jgi:hypothetical protein